MSDDSIVVQKYGGSSVRSAERIKAVSERVVSTKRQGHGVVVVVSAMGKTTDQLLERVCEVTPNPPKRELDMLLSCGEQMSMSLLAMAIQQLGEDAISLTGGMAGIVTDNVHASARIQDVNPDRVLAELARGRVVVVAGFQGQGPDHEIYTLGRGGSDATAIALAASLNAARCEIYSDVDGVYTADPRVVETASRLDRIGYDTMREMSRHGAKVLNTRAIELASSLGVEVHALSSYEVGDGTVIAAPVDTQPMRGYGVDGVAGRDDIMRLQTAAEHLKRPPEDLKYALEGCDVLLRRGHNGHQDLLVATENVADEDAFASELRRDFGAGIDVTTGLGSVAAIGETVSGWDEVAGMAHQALSLEGIGVKGASTGQVSLTCVVQREAVHSALRSLHHALIEVAPA